MTNEEFNALTEDQKDLLFESFENEDWDNSQPATVAQLLKYECKRLIDILGYIMHYSVACKMKLTDDKKVDKIYFFDDSILIIDADNKLDTSVGSAEGVETIPFDEFDYWG